MPQLSLRSFLSPQPSSTSVLTALRDNIIDENRRLSSTESKQRKRRAIDHNSDMDPKQMILDAGQKSFGHVHCSECDMVYAVNIVSDVDAHRRHHNRLLLTDSICIDSKTMKQWRQRIEPIQDTFDGRIYKLNADSPMFAINRVESLLVDNVNVELGYSESSKWTSNRKCAFVFITEECNAKIAGIVVIESIKIAQKYESNEELQSTDQQPLLGINRLWVHGSFRNHRIATRLIDCARCNFIVGYPIDRKYCAFSDPTENGLTFAIKYLNGKNDLLIYRIT